MLQCRPQETPRNMCDNNRVLDQQGTFLAKPSSPRGPARLVLRLPPAQSADGLGRSSTTLAMGLAMPASNPRRREEGEGRR